MSTPEAAITRADVASTADGVRAASSGAGTIRLGIIGFGKMGRIRLEAVREHGGGRVLAIADPDQRERIDGARICGSADEIYADPEIEAVFICTPNHLNRPLTIAALRAGKHVFCEKPPAFTAAEMEEIIAAERASGRKLMYGFNHRHHDSIKKAKELIDGGVHGRLLWMRGRYGKSVDERFYSDWRSKRELAGGGILMDQGIHMVDLFLMMGGEFDDVRAFVSNLYWKLDVEDNVFALLRNRATGVVASLHSTMTQWRHLFSLEMFLEHGYIVINGLLTSSGTYGEETMTIAKNRSAAPAAIWSDEEHLRYDVNTSWQSEVAHFLSAIRHDHPIGIGSSQDALKLMRVIDLIYREHRD